jgi:hypothetical protein
MPTRAEIEEEMRVARANAGIALAGARAAYDSAVATIHDLFSIDRETDEGRLKVADENERR